MEANTREFLKEITLISGKEFASTKVEKDEDQAILVKKSELSKDEEVEKLGNDKEVETPKLSKNQPSLPYPAKVMKDQQDEQFEKFMDMFKTLHINASFVDVLAQMRCYAKFLKELLTNKKKLEDVSMVTLSEECSVVLTN